jgi:hypothetical protein
MAILPNMRYALTFAALLGFAVNALADTAGCQILAGTQYCNAAQVISWSNFGMSGTYDRVVAMDSADGYCGKQSTTYAGGMAPFDEEVSWHFRGPVKLKQFGWYTPAASVSAKRDLEDGEIKKRGCGGIATATINGLMQTWQNEWCPGEALTSTAAAVPSTFATTAIATAPTTIISGISAKPAPWISSVSSIPSTPTSSPQPAIRSWVRQGYYGATQGVNDGVIFLNNLGGPGGSGVSDQ